MKPLLAAAACAAALLCCGAAPATLNAAPPTRVEFLNYSAPVPTTWQAQPPASSFRAAQFRVPAASGSGDGEAIVFYFGKGQGGSAAANAERWGTQFTAPDGQPVKPKVETLNVHGMAATLVELTGTYARGVGMGPQGTAKPNQTLLAAVIESPDGNVIFQLHGDKPTVEQHRGEFVEMIKGFKPR